MTDYWCRDIVDHCSWRSTVANMLTGSIAGNFDEYDPEELEITYSYSELIAMFRRFNHGSTNSGSVSYSGLLAPASRHFAPPPATSSALSSQWRHSAPLETRDRQSRESWRSQVRQFGPDMSIKVEPPSTADQIARIASRESFKSVPKPTGFKNMEQAKLPGIVANLLQRSEIAKNAGSSSLGTGTTTTRTEEEYDFDDHDNNSETSAIHDQSTLDQVEHTLELGNSIDSPGQCLHGTECHSFQCILMEWIHRHQHAGAVPEQQLRDLEVLVSEIQYIDPRQIYTSEVCEVGVVDYLKGQFEDAIGEPWDWWPLKPCSRAIPDGESRLWWTCVSELPID